MSTSLSMLEAFGMQARSLINELEDTFPPQTPTPDQSISSIMYRSGQRSVVEWILNKLDEEKNGMESSPL